MTKLQPAKSIILYADDDPDDVQLVKDSLQEHFKDYQLLTFEDGEKLLAFLKGNEGIEPCLIILDINMPGLDGKKTLAGLRKMDRFQNNPVILFSTSSSELDKLFASQYGAGFITKPLNMSQMSLITDQFLNHCSEEIRTRLRK